MSILTCRVDLPEAVAFIEKKLAAYDLSKIDKFTLAAALRTQQVSWKTHLPERVSKGSRKFKSQYRLYASVNQTPQEDVYALSVRSLLDEAVSQSHSPLWETCARLWGRSEHLIFGAGCTSFQYLRRTRQTPGVARGSDSRRFASAWVSEYAPRRDRFYLHLADQTKTDPLYVTCFGVLLNAGLVNRPIVDPEAMFFDTPVERLIDNADSPGAEMAQAALRTWPDVDPGLIKAIAAACAVLRYDSENHVREDLSAAWQVLADWLEERGDRRAAWLRSQTISVPPCRPVE